MVGEVFVDRDVGAVEVDGAGLFPGGGVGGAAGFAAAQDQQVRDHAGPGGALVGAGGEADRAEKVGESGDLAAGGRCCGRPLCSGKSAA